MTDHKEVTYALDFCAGGMGPRENKSLSSNRQPAREPADSIPRNARLMALVIRFESLVREEKMRDYAELARLGRVTRARMTQIMKLRYLAPDIQEQILFLPNAQGLNERSLRPVVSRIDWGEQRRLFRRITDRCKGAGDSGLDAERFSQTREPSLPVVRVGAPLLPDAGGVQNPDDAHARK